ncbi:Sec-independent protein translocase protein TatB [Pseudonocardia acidicola]|uniref:Sec-independent protein translocase protein TatB n=1 Tax=Pseudonocardia acidicola TaxID=2724939 RepID=A0ABX1SGR8_9PSEU|nr:Sec-independent protein translocase protein TatB [Pseudonocardia acidicola]NMI00764.1 Sec-independent protein translocase subunit TatB [Pseudonocardia acidicola]
MFGLGWERLFLLVLIALFVLGPERLPGAMEWLGRTVRQVKSYLDGAREQLREEFGPELAELRKPLADLPITELRALRDPRAAAMRYLFSDGARDSAGPSTPPAPAPVLQPAPAPVPLTQGERPPIDPDAT